MAPSKEEQSRAAAAAAEEKGEAGGGGSQKQFVDLSAKNPLKPRRRAQIEVWLDETVGLWGMQHCAAGGLFGHCSDLLTPSTGADQPGEGPRPARDDTCPVCGRSPEGEKEPIATQPGRAKSRLDGAGPGKGRHVLRGILAAMGRSNARGGGRGGEDKEDEAWDRAVSTHMFLADPSQYGSSVSFVSTGSGSSGPSGRGDARKGAAEWKALEQRMARLARAQKLLERSQATR